MIAEVDHQLSSRTAALARRVARTKSRSSGDASRRRQAVAERLVGRCAAGDPQALAELHELFSGQLLRLARGIVRSTEAAEEVVQEVFLYVWQRADRYDRRRAAVSTWLGQITRSRAIDRLRKAGARNRARALAQREGATSVEPRAERELHAGQERVRLRRALRVLPEAQREVLLLAYYGEMSQREIAARSRIPLGTVKTRTFLALRKLRQELSPATS